MWGEDADGLMALTRAKALCARLEAAWSADLSNSSAHVEGTASGGLGVYLSGTTVFDFLPDSPAPESGLQKGDKILKVACVTMQCSRMMAANWH